MKAILASGHDAFSLIETLIEREKIDCFWEKKGRFVGAWTPKDYKFQESRVASLNADADSGAYMVPRERQREEMASDYYYGGMVVERSAKLHPALYYKGLLDAARRRKITICAKAAVKTHQPSRQRLAHRHLARRHRGRRRRHRHQRLHGRCDAAAQAPPDPARQPHHRHRGAAARPRAHADPEGPHAGRYQARALLLPHVAGQQAHDLRRTRPLHAGDAGDQRADPAPVHDGSLPAAEGHPRHPCLDRQRRLHLGRAAAYRRAWTACTMRWAATAAASP